MASVPHRCVVLDMVTTITTNHCLTVAAASASSWAITASCIAPAPFRGFKSSRYFPSWQARSFLFLFPSVFRRSFLLVNSRRQPSITTRERVSFSSSLSQPPTRFTNCDLKLKGEWMVWKKELFCERNSHIDHQLRLYRLVGPPLTEYELITLSPFYRRRTQP